MPGTSGATLALRVPGSFLGAETIRQNLTHLWEIARTWTERRPCGGWRPTWLTAARCRRLPWVEVDVPQRVRSRSLDGSSSAYRWRPPARDRERTRCGSLDRWRSPSSAESASRHHWVKLRGRNEWLIDALWMPVAWHSRGVAARSTCATRLAIPIIAWSCSRARARESGSGERQVGACWRSGRERYE